MSHYVISSRLQTGLVNDFRLEFERVKYSRHLFDLFARMKTSLLFKVRLPLRPRRHSTHPERAGPTSLRQATKPREGRPVSGPVRTEAPRRARPRSEQAGPHPRQTDPGREAGPGPEARRLPRRDRNVRRWPARAPGALAEALIVSIASPLSLPRPRPRIPHSADLAPRIPHTLTSRISETSRGSRFLYIASHRAKRRQCALHPDGTGRASERATWPRLTAAGPFR